MFRTKVTPIKDYSLYKLFYDAVEREAKVKILDFNNMQYNEMLDKIKVDFPDSPELYEFCFKKLDANKAYVENDFEIRMEIKRRYIKAYREKELPKVLKRKNLADPNDSSQNEQEKRYDKLIEIMAYVFACLILFGFYKGVISPAVSFFDEISVNRSIESINKESQIIQTDYEIENRRKNADAIINPLINQVEEYSKHTPDVYYGDIINDLERSRVNESRNKYNADYSNSRDTIMRDARKRYEKALGQ